MVKELNIFIDNKPGRLQAVTTLLSEKNINIRALTIQDRDDFGLMKLIVDKPDEAYLAISDNGFACALKDILAIQIEDRPGGLNKLLGILAENKINIKDSYAFVIKAEKYAVLCIEVENIETVKKLLFKTEFKLLEDKDLYNL
jgi:hypothetical protein